MMQPLREKMACLLTESARQWAKELDKKSELYRELKGENVDAILKNNIHKICMEMTLPEMCKGIALAAKFAAGGKDRLDMEKQIKEIARGIVKRIEKKRGGFSGPASCRAALYNYLGIRST